MCNSVQVSLPVPPGRRLGPAAPDPAERSPCVSAGATPTTPAQERRPAHSFKMTFIPCRSYSRATAFGDFMWSVAFGLAGPARLSNGS